MTTDGGGGPQPAGRAETLSEPEAETVARLLAPLRLAGSDAAGGAAMTFGDLIGIGEPASFSAASGWAVGGRLRVPIGVDSRPASAVVLDLKESAQDGMGPHGLLIGATGSGKSELLRYARARPRRDARLGDAQLRADRLQGRCDVRVARSAAAHRRGDHQPRRRTAAGRPDDRRAATASWYVARSCCAAAGNVASLRDYERALRRRPAAAAGAADRLRRVHRVAVGQAGVHRPVRGDRVGSAGRSAYTCSSPRNGWTRAGCAGSTRTCRTGSALRTFSAMESRAVLGVAGRVRTATRAGTRLPEVRHRAAGAVQGGVRVRAVGDDRLDAGHRRRSRCCRSPAHRSASRPRPARPAESGCVAACPARLDVLAEPLAGAGTPAHQVWLPPLGHAGAAGPAARTGRRRPPSAASPPSRPCLADGCASRSAWSTGRSSSGATRWWLDLGRRRRPRGDRRRDRSPASRRAVRTLITALALTHTPREVTFYCLDFGGGALRDCAGLPHVGAVVGPARADGGPAYASARSRRCCPIASAASRPTASTRRPAPSRGTAGAATRTATSSWSSTAGPRSASDYDDLEPVITDIATRGLSYGVHVVVTAGRWTDLRPGAARPARRRVSSCGSAIRPTRRSSRKVAGDVPGRAPGRGLTGRRALPR